MPRLVATRSGCGPPSRRAESATDRCRGRNVTRSALQPRLDRLSATPRNGNDRVKEEPRRQEFRRPADTPREPLSVARPARRISTKGAPCEIPRTSQWTPARPNGDLKAVVGHHHRARGLRDGGFVGRHGCSCEPHPGHRCEFGCARCSRGEPGHEREVHTIHTGWRTKGKKPQRLVWKKKGHESHGAARLKSPSGDKVVLNDKPNTIASARKGQVVKATVWVRDERPDSPAAAPAGSPQRKPGRAGEAALRRRPQMGASNTYLQGYAARSVT